MSTESAHLPPGAAPEESGMVEMPRPNVWPMVLSLGVALMAAGLATSLAFSMVGGVIFLVGLFGWIGELLPGRGHHHEALAAPKDRPQPVTAAPGTVEQLLTGMPGYRVQLPVKMHPISAGVKGGLVGGLVIPIPALAYGLLSGHGLWYPVNLLAGMALPVVGDMSVADLERFHGGFFLAGLVIHVTVSVVFGLLYGVLLPMLPEIPRPLSWGGLLMPLLWTGATFGTMEIVSPVLARGVDWPWFIASQFVFGLVSATVFMRVHTLRPIPAGIVAGLVGGISMPVPAVLWGLVSGHGIWYPVNLLAGMVMPSIGGLPRPELEAFHPNWLAAATMVHLVMSMVFGMLYGLILPRLRPIPAPLAWGGMLMPMLWTGASYGLMGVVNPVLQQRVEWPWFIVSQFLFGVAAAVVVLRSEQIPIPPAGRGPSA